MLYREAFESLENYYKSNCKSRRTLDKEILEMFHGRVTEEGHEDMWQLLVQKNYKEYERRTALVPPMSEEMRKKVEEECNKPIQY